MDKIIKFVYNAVIVPKLEYLSQIVFFENLFRPIRRSIKNILRFQSTAPDVIIDSNLLFGFKLINDNQIQAKINNFFIFINDTKILKPLVDIRLIE